MKRYRTLFIIVVLLAVAIWINLPSTTGIARLKWGVKTSLGLDLVGGVQILMEADVPATSNVTATQMSDAVKVVENRVNGLGVSEAVVQQVGTRRVAIELPGQADPQQALDTVKSTGLLEFVDMSSISQTQASTLVGKTIKTNYQTSAVVVPTQTVTSTNTLQDTVWTTVLTGQDLQDAGVKVDSTNQYQVTLTFNAAGGTKFADFTGGHVGSVLAIVLDKVVLSVPTIQTKITDNQAVITGSFTYDTANQLAIQLRYGALPVPLKVVETQVIGPSLGKDSLQKSLLAGGIGLGIVVLFMALYYRLPGIVADLALICYALFAYAIFRGIPVTLTLPGIAGFVLSIGMAVDANILIFERMKEELRAGRSLESAIDLGWSRAWPSIRDSNSSTIITCIILYIFGSTYGASIVKGFSLTLALGVGVSLFTAVIVTRTFLHLVLDRVEFVEHTRWFGI